MKPGPESDRVLLANIRQCIERIRDYTEGSKTIFYDSSMVQDAVVHNLRALAGSTRKLSESIKATKPAVPWKEIAKFRNVLTHDYIKIDLAVVWSEVEINLLELESAIERMARTLRSD